VTRRQGVMFARARQDAHTCLAQAPQPTKKSDKRVMGWGSSEEAGGRACWAHTHLLQVPAAIHAPRSD